MSDAHRTDLVADTAASTSRAIDAVLGIGLVTFVLATASLFDVAPVGGEVAGVTVATLFGGVLLLEGVAVVAVGALSRAGVVETAPDRSAGLVAGVALGVIGLAFGGALTAAATGGPLWVLGSLVGGVGLVAATILPREDVGSTLPTGAVVATLGLVVLSGVLDVSWTWNPEALDGGFTGGVAITLLTLFGLLLATWAGAKARGGFGARGRELGAYMLIYLNAFAMLAAMISIVAFVAMKGAPYAFAGVELTSSFPFVDWPFVMRPSIPLGDVRDGILPAIVGTVWLVVGASTFAVPLGVGAAVFLTEYAEQGRAIDTVEVATNALWSTPSVVFGLFGAAFFIPRFGGDRSLLSGMLVLGFMLLPLVLITSRESLKAVPDEYRDASVALGVDQWTTIRSVVLPAAMPGVITGIILGIGRIAGETAPLILVLGSPLNSTSAVDVLGGFQLVARPPFVVNDALMAETATLPTQIWAIIAAGVSGSTEKGWGTAFVLLMVVLTFYAVGIASRTYFRRKLHYE
jgi:phosphate transport system permease protein